MVLFSLVLFLDAITVSGNAIAIDGLRIAPKHLENIEEGKLVSTQLQSFNNTFIINSLSTS